MTATIAPLTERPAWKALETHYQRCIEDFLITRDFPKGVGSATDHREVDYRKSWSISELII